MLEIINPELKAIIGSLDYMGIDKTDYRFNVEYKGMEIEIIKSPINDKNKEEFINLFKMFYSATNLTIKVFNYNPDKFYKVQRTIIELYCDKFNNALEIK